MNVATAPDGAETGSNGAGTPSRDYSSLLDEIENLRLEGTFLMRGEFTEPWGFQSGGGIRLGLGRRVAAFHVVADGECWASLGPDDERHWARRGDIMVFPYAAEHILGGREPAHPVTLPQVVAPPPWERMPVVRHGGDGGASAKLVCAYVVTDHPLFDPAFRAFPPCSWCARRPVRP